MTYTDMEVLSGFRKLFETKQKVFQACVIQPPTPINPGNSGGPLVDSGDRVVERNSTALMGAQSISFAVPINIVTPIITELRTHGRIILPWLGGKGNVVTDERRNLIALSLVSGSLMIDVAGRSPADPI
ncbi:MAG: hypothetical protein KF722_06750 [Nitrospira sp.]|nr:hypothetical protein [Nitrospira sp.]